MKLIYSLLFFIVLSGLSDQSMAQKLYPSGNVEGVFKDQIQAVRLTVNGNPLTYPILDGDDYFSLSFDDLSGDSEDYAYTILHCNADWKASNLNPLEYIDGYITDDIRDYEYSFNTLVDYTHFQFELPNSNMRWTKSGNYLLKVFVSGNEEDIVLTRRFMVVEKQMNIGMELVRPFDIGKFKTHHEIDFTVLTGSVNVRDPKTEIKVVVMQNGRWDNAITGLEPLFIRGSELVYDYQDKVVFPALREFRRFDARSTRYRADRIRALEDDGRMTYMSVVPDKVRAGEIDDSYADINGRFFIDNLHEDEPELESDYVEVYFQLPMEQQNLFGNIYIFGELTDWAIKDQALMKYDENLRSYIGNLRLKQGYYNYAYAYLNNGSATLDLSAIEGNWWETENDYHILVYYRSFGARADELVAVSYLNSNTIRQDNSLRILGLERVLGRR